MGPYPKSKDGNRFILVAMDTYSRWTEARASPNATAGALRKFLYEDVICRHGYPKVLLTDNGSQFRSDVWRRMCRTWQCEAWTTPIYHPRANPVERRNQEIKKQLRILVEGKDARRWDEYLSTALFHLRTRANAATGATPANCLTGRELSRPGEWALDDHLLRDNRTLQEKHEDLLRKQQHYQRRYTDNDAQPPTLSVGQSVAVKEHRGGGIGLFAPNYSDGWKITAKLGSHTYRIEHYDGRYRKVHEDKLRLLPDENAEAFSDADDDAPDDADDTSPSQADSITSELPVPAADLPGGPPIHHLQDIPEAQMTTMPVL